MAGTKDAVLMVESEASGLTEKEMLDAAVKFGHDGFVSVVKGIEKLSKNVLRMHGKLKKKRLQ